MNPRLARLLTRLYPRRWRERYGAEFEALLEMGCGDFRAAANVVRSALWEHIFPLRGMKMNRLSSSLAAILCAYLAVIAAGVNFYATVDDSPLVAAMQAHSDFSLAWNLVAAGSIVALIGALAMLAPLALGALRFAIAEKRRDILLHLLSAPLSAGILAVWLIGATVVSGGHWTPAPWAITGDWIASPNWPGLQERWLLGSFSAGLAVLLMVVSSIGATQAIRRTRYEEVRFTILGRVVAFHPLRLARIPGMVTAAAIGMMTLGVLAWGWIANQQATAAFHAYFGPLHTTALISWMGSACVFAAASVVALRRSSALLRLAGE